MAEHSVTDVAPHSILVADDEPIVRDLLVRVLQREGYDARAARDGAAAVRALDEHNYDLVVSDISMPNLNGLDLLKEVRRKELTVPMILMTGLPEADSAIRALRYGAWDYLPKPVTPQHLLQCVRRALDKAKRQGHPKDADGRLDRALRELRLVFQPVVNCENQTLFGHEALVRSTEPTLSRPDRLLDAVARHLAWGRLSSRIAELAEEALQETPGRLLINVHPHELSSGALGQAATRLAASADRIVFEITGHDHHLDINPLVAASQKLQNAGFTLGLDSLGSGYANLHQVVALKPKLAKIDMALVRGLPEHPMKQTLVSTVVRLARDFDITLIAKGVETQAERDALRSLGCPLMQGFLWGPHRSTPQAPQKTPPAPEPELSGREP